MLTIERRQEIVSLLTTKSFFRLNELAQKLNASISTIRRDINTLQEEGVVQRTHGGVVFLGERNALPYFHDRQTVCAEEKKQIAQFAATLVEDGETVIIDGGTTPYQVAVALKNKNIQVVTNSLPVANLFADSRNVQLVSTGGVLHPGTGVYLGPYANNTLKNIRAQKAFMGVAGITGEGLYNSNALVVETEQFMLHAVSEVYVVADYTKFGRHALAFLCDFTLVTGIITVQPPTEEKQKTLNEVEAKGVSIIYTKR